MSGDQGGALRTGVSDATMPKISQLINEMDLPAEIKKDLKQVTSTALGAIVGGAKSKSMNRSK